MLEDMCSRCGAILTLDNWYPSTKGRSRRVCIPCERKRNKKWVGENRGYVNKYARNRRHDAKITVIQHYSPDGICQCKESPCWHKGRCNVADMDVLSLDHIKGGGNKQRKKTGNGSETYLWVIRHNFPKGFRIFCENCQRKKQHRNKEWTKRRHYK
jgi:hypothetical protein